MKKLRRSCCVLAFFCLSFWLAPVYAEGAGQYLSVKDFLANSFSGDAPPRPKMLWLNAALKQKMKAVTGRKLSLLRVRYWQRGERTAWILQEVGKELPITIGVVVDGRKLDSVEILAFRESRGWEIRHPFFTNQFRGLGLNSRQQLDRPIDGLSGATLSVRAVSYVSRLALLFSQEVLPDAEADK
ncbi:MAG: FMN-binding protein [Spongiibacteraceae bacterium]